MAARVVQDLIPDQAAFPKEPGKGWQRTVLTVHGYEKGRSRSIHLIWKGFPLYMLSVYVYVWGVF